MKHSTFNIQHSTPKAARRAERCAVYVLAALWAIWLLVLVGCTTVTPRVVESAGASFDGGVRNSGFIGWTTNGWGILTPHAHDRYLDLAKNYGERFHPPLDVSRGVMGVQVDHQPDTWLFSPEALADFAAMNRWRRMEGK